MCDISITYDVITVIRAKLLISTAADIISISIFYYMKFFPCSCNTSITYYFITFIRAKISRSSTFYIINPIDLDRRRSHLFIGGV